MLPFIFRRAPGFLLLTLVLMGVGMVTMSRLPVMMYPQTRRPMVQVDIRHSGISAIDFQDQYAEDIEDRLLSLEDLDLLQTTYSTDSSRFNMTFDWNVDSDTAKSDVENLMVSINSSLPEEIRDNYYVRYREGENAGYLIMGLTAQSVSSEELYQILKNTMEPKLNRIPNVEELGFYNTQRLLVDIELNQRRMLSYGVTITDVNTALQGAFLPQPLGSLFTPDGRLSVRLQKNSKELETLARLEIKKVGDTSITLDDIADVDIRYALPRQVFLVEGVPAVQLTATPAEGGNVYAMTGQIRDIMKEAQTSGILPADIEYSLYLDPAKYIQKSINNVVQSALLGGILAIVIVFLILGEFKNTLIIAASLPVTIVLSFILMGIFGISLNLISLGGLALAVGMIVDATIVVMENINRHRLDNLHLQEAGGNEGLSHWRNTVFKAVKEVQSPVIVSAVTSALVFIPISFTAPLTNAILGEQARTVIFALLLSMVVSLTVVPLVAYYLFRKHKPPKRKKTLTGGIQKATRGFVRIYERSLSWVLDKKRRAGGFLALSFAALVLAVIFVFPSIPKEIISTPTSDRVVLTFRNANITGAEEVINDVLPGISSRIDEALGDMMLQKFTNASMFRTQIFIDLKSSDYSDEAINRLQKIFVSEGDWYYNIMSWDPAELPLPQSFDFQMSLYGPDAAQKVELLSTIQNLLNEEEFYQRIFTQPSSSIVRQLNLKPREETIGSFPPWSENSLSALVRRIVSGTASITLSDGREDVDVNASYPDEELDSREELENFLVPWNQNFIPLKHFFDFSTSQGVSQIYGENGELVFRLNGSAGSRISDFQRLRLQEEARAYLSDVLFLPEGYSYSFDNPRAEMDEAITSLFYALGISILLMYLFLVFQFNSFKTPLIILVTIPLGFLGVILALRLFNSTLNLNSLLGTILLGGVAINNAIIMIDFYLKYRWEYKTKKEAIVASASLRFQPILITTMTTVFGMLPLAIGMGEGSNILQPLGVAVAGGLFVSTFLTLYAVPALLLLSHSGKGQAHLPEEPDNPKKSGPEETE